MARQAFGPGYDYHVPSMNIMSGNGVTVANGMVTAWNADEVRHIPLAWEER